MAAPAVSVLMPVYNGERWLAPAIESVLAQTFTDFELIAVDDGSTDSSASIVESFAQADSRVRLVRAEHAGLPTARAISMAEARAPFVAFLDQDDEWAPERLERQLPHVDERTLVFSDFWYRGDGDTDDGTLMSESFSLPALRYPSTGLFPHLLALGCFIHISTVLAPRAALLDAGSFRYAELHGFPPQDDCDYEMWLLLALRGLSFQYLDEPLVVYRRHADSLSADLVKTYKNDLRVMDSLMVEAWGGDRRLVRDARRRLQRMLDAEHRKRGLRRLVTGDTRGARRELGGSLRVRPYSVRAWLALVLSLCPPLARPFVRGRV